MLGLDRSRAELVPYDKTWKQEFKELKAELEKIFAENLLQIEHVGSTSIEGMAAKPILDAAVVVKEIRKADFSEMAKAGFDYAGDDLGTGKHLFVNREPGETSTHHVGLYLEGNQNFRETILFRDYLRNHPAAAESYQSLKLSLAARYPENRALYTENKAHFIRTVIASAEKEKGLQPD